MAGPPEFRGDVFKIVFISMIPGLRKCALADGPGQFLSRRTGAMGAAANYRKDFAPRDFVHSLSRQHSSHDHDQSVRFTHPFVEMLEVEILITFVKLLRRL